MKPEVVQRLVVGAYTVPTDAPESDGTMAWDATTMVVVEAHAGGMTGLGYTYGDVAVAALVDSTLRAVAEGSDALTPHVTWAAMRRALRNAGQPGVGAMAVSAVDIALHDLRARLLGLPLARALGAWRDSAPVYGSGGFTSYSMARLREQLGGWVADGIPRVKMKVGREPGQDLERIAAVRDAIGGAELMVDANGAYDQATAPAWAERYAAAGATWLEEPVTSDDLTGLRRVRDHAPAGLAIAAGEYIWSLFDAARTLDAQAVDVLQADVTRCCGITEALRIDALCKAADVPFSAHCAPAVSAHVGCAMETFTHLEYFHDHVRVEGMLLDGVLVPVDGRLHPDPSRPGLGLELRREDAERFRR
jgi:L-alanine-DL-glutamate epimerase-like enolase superfamily enzyme